jgi:hypothetical protein
MKIQPVITWDNGIEKQLTEFILETTYDDLNSYAIFQYLLYEKYNHDTNDIAIKKGELTISGDDYKEWDIDPSANAWAYNWAATKLNLVILSE